MRQPNGIDNGFVKDSDRVMLLQSVDQSPHHFDA